MGAIDVGDVERHRGAGGAARLGDQFRGIIGCRDRAEFVIAIACQALLAAETNATVRRHASPLPGDRQPVRIAVQVPRRSEHPRAASFADELSGFCGILFGCQS
jgi:hypothetical protein